MPLFAAAALPFTMGAIGATATATGAIIGANKQSNAAKTAAQLQTDAANKAAELQAKSQADALAFQQKQDALDRQTANVTNQANYGQWAARENRMSNFGQMLGLGARDIPAYVPLPMTDTSTGGTTGGTGTTATGGIPKSTGDVAKDMQLANQLSGSNHTDPNYWINAGYAKDPQYFFQKMLGMDAGGADVAKIGPYAGMSAAGGGAKSTAGPAATSPYSSNSMAAYLPITPALQMPSPYTNSFASYTGARA